MGDMMGMMYGFSVIIFLVVFCLLLSLPVERQIMEVLFREMMLSSISGWITMWVDPMIYVKMTAIGIAAYAVVAVLEFRRIPSCAHG